MKISPVTLFYFCLLSALECVMIAGCAPTPPARDAEISKVQDRADEPVADDAEPTAVEERIDVRIHVADAEPFDLQGFIDARISAGDTTIVIPPGRHLVTPRNREHLRLEGLRDIVIEATGTELVCSETTRAITIHDCENLTLRGLTIDYDPLPFTQARILAISEDKTQLELELIPGYADFGAPPVKLETFNPETKELRGRVTFYRPTIEQHDDGRATLTRPAGRAAGSRDEVGDIAVLHHQHTPGGNTPHAIMATDSRGLVFENVTLYAANTFGFYENGCDGSRYINCVVDRRPPGLDYAVRGYPRMRSLNADAFHSKNARVGPLYERCIARYNGDDSIAINGDFHFVSAAGGNTLRVLAKNEMTMRAGDTVQLITRDGIRLPGRKVTALEPLGPATDEDREFVATPRWIEPRTRARTLQQAWAVSLDAPVDDIPPASLIASADAIGNGFEVRDCHLGHNQSRGILLKAGHGRIIGNTFSGSIMATILVAPEYFWLEAGFSDNVVIADNTLRDIRGPGIVVTVFASSRNAESPVGEFRNLVIRDNTISGGPAPGILVSSVDGLVVENNTVKPDPAKRLSPWEMNTWGRDGIEPVMIQNSKQTPAPQ